MPGVHRPGYRTPDVPKAIRESDATDIYGVAGAFTRKLRGLVRSGDFTDAQAAQAAGMSRTSVRRYLDETDVAVGHRLRNIQKKVVRTCRACGALYTTNSPRYCSPECREAVAAARKALRTDVRKMVENGGES